MGDNGLIKKLEQLATEEIIRNYSVLTSTNENEIKVKCNAFLDLIGQPGDPPKLIKKAHLVSLILNTIIPIESDSFIFKKDISFWEHACIQSCYSLIKFCLRTPSITILNINSGGFKINMELSNNGEQILNINHLHMYNEDWKNKSSGKKDKDLTHHEKQMKMFFTLYLKRNTLVSLFDMEERNFHAGGYIRLAVDEKLANLDQILYTIDTFQEVIDDNGESRLIFANSNTYSVRRYLEEICQGRMQRNWMTYKQSVKNPHQFDTPSKTIV
jgi:hypothetical protein